MNRIIFLLTLFLSFPLYSQVSQVWLSRYNGTGNGYDEATTIFLDNSGNVYVTGGSNGSGGSGRDFLTIKYNSAGNIEWTARYNGPGNNIDDAYGLKVDAAGNVYVYGASTGSGTGLDYCTIKYNSSGVQQWVSRYNGPGNATDEAYSISIDNNGNVYITGYSNGGNSMDDICSIKYNSNGAEQWIRRYNGSLNNDDYGNSIVTDNQGNSYVTGAVTTSTDLDYITIKYDTDGNIIWTNFYDGTANGEDFPSSNAIDNSGNIYVAGYSFGSGSNADYLTMKINSNGTTAWTARYNGPANSVDESWNVILDNANNVYVTGNSTGSGTGDDYCSVKYDNNGNQQWVAIYNGNGAGDDYANWIAVDITGNVYVTGVSKGIGQFDDIATIGYNSSGVQQWAVRYNGTGNEYDSGNSLAVDGNGNVYVTGGSDNPNNTDYVTIRYSSTIGINPLSNESPSDYILFQNFPNPFNPETMIRFDVRTPIHTHSASEETKVVLKVYDISGRETATLVNESLKPGSFQVKWNGSEFSSGVYFYSLTIRNGAENYSETRRMVLIK